MIAVIETGKGDLKIDIPYSCGEITFSEFIDFRAANQLMYPKDEEGEEVNVDEHDYYSLMTSCVLKIVKVVDGDVSQLPFGVDEDIEQLLNDDFTLSIGDEVTLIRLYCHITSLIDNYKPLTVDNTFHVEIKGEYFFIEPDMAKRVLGLEKTYTTGEVIEVKKFQQKFGKAIEKGDIEGNLAFTLGLSELAVVLRKNNETLPIDIAKREAFYKKRQLLFQSLPMTTVIDIRYFFLSILKRFAETLPTNTSLKEKKDSTQGQQPNKRHNKRVMPNGKLNWTEHLILSDGRFTTM